MVMEVKAYDRVLEACLTLLNGITRIEDLSESVSLGMKRTIKTAGDQFLEFLRFIKHQVTFQTQSEYTQNLLAITTQLLSLIVALREVYTTVELNQVVEDTCNLASHAECVDFVILIFVEFLSRVNPADP